MTERVLLQAQADEIELLRSVLCDTCVRLPATLQESGPEFDQRPSAVIVSPTPAELSGISENREVFRVFLGPLPRRHSPEEMRV